MGLFSALPVDSSWSCGKKWGLRPARGTGSHSRPRPRPSRHALPSPSPLSWSSSGEHSCLCHSRGSRCSSWGQRSPQEIWTAQVPAPCSFHLLCAPPLPLSAPPCPPTPQQGTYNGAEPVSSSEQSRGSHMQEKGQASGVPHTDPSLGGPDPQHSALSRPWDRHPRIGCLGSWWEGYPRAPLQADARPWLPHQAAQ